MTHKVSAYVDFFFFKQKTAYEIDMCLEFRRVLFRSTKSHVDPSAESAGSARSRWRSWSASTSGGGDLLALRAPPGPRVRPQHPACDDRGRSAGQIGRASCRERVENAGGGRALKKKVK